MEIITALRTAWAYRRFVVLGGLVVLSAHYYALAASRGGKIDELQAQINLRDQLASHYQARADASAKALSDYRENARKARKKVTGTKEQDQEHIPELIRRAIDAGLRE